jgi:signal transduction histidine kinase
MTNDILDKLNETLALFLKTESFTKLTSVSVNEAVKLVSASEGMLLLLEKGKIRKVSHSSQRITLTSIDNNNQFAKIAQSQTITVIDAKTVQLWNVLQLPNEITTVVFMPILNGNENFECLVLFFDNVNMKLSQTQTKMLQIMQSILSLVFAHAKQHTSIAHISHELKTPLTAIHGYIQLLHNRISQQNSTEACWVKELHQESARMTAMIQELLLNNVPKPPNRMD